MIDISVVIITWKMKALLNRMLSSLVENTYGVNYELIIVDNASNDGTIELINTKFPQATLIRNKHNVGVAPARNQGLKIARGRYIAILDADMEIKENSLKMLFDFLEKDSSIGLVGCKLVDSEGLLQYSCKRFPTFFALLLRRFTFFSFACASEVLNYHIMKDYDHIDVTEVDYVIGACQFFRVDLIDKIGSYDENIFYGPEDLDYCLRVWRSGLKVYYNPITEIVHHEQRITKKRIISLITLKHFIAIFYLFKKYNFKLTRE